MNYGYCRTTLSTLNYGNYGIPLFKLSVLQDYLKDPKLW